MPIKDAYSNNHVDFEISNIKYEEDSTVSGDVEERIGELQAEISNLETRETSAVDATIDSIISKKEEIRELRSQSSSGSISFEYSAPAISIDSAGRFIKHEIIGGMTVRQKIGEDPMNVDISGVCKESVAKQLDELRNAKYGDIFSNRLPGESLTVQFASVSTSPLDDNGAVALTDSDSEFLYQYTISAVEVDL